MVLAAQQELRPPEVRCACALLVTPYDLLPFGIVRPPCFIVRQGYSKRPPVVKLPVFSSGALSTLDFVGVIPAQAGIQTGPLDSRVRENDSSPQFCF